MTALFCRAVAVLLQNVSEDSVPGPILIVVPIDLGIDGLSHSNSDGLVLSGESFVEVLDEKKSLKPNRKLLVLRSSFLMCLSLIPTDRLLLG